ncbi:MAG TPA: CNP1-like family protein [Ideonella sp.]|nr:CNP1-like family protein [Ideonella sp.]
MRALVASLVVALAGCASGTSEMSDWERDHALRQPAAEEEPALPPYPDGANLIGVDLPGAGDFRFFVDGATLVAGRDGIIRYVLVARSPDGAQNVSFEGLRCASADQRVYALGRADRSWVPAQGEWRRLPRPWHAELYRRYFCPQKQPIRSADEGRRALEQGGHPFARSLGSDDLYSR